VAEVVTCPACRGGQLRRRGDPLCPPCAGAALKVAPGPLWVLDSPLLRSVLAEVNVPAVVAVVRAACGLSQRGMAEVVGWSPAVLSYYERGRRNAVFDVRVVLQFADAVGMPRSALLALLLGDPDPDAGSLPDQAGSTQRGVTGVRLRYWRACTDALHARERAAGGTSLLRPALLLWRQASGALHGTNRVVPGNTELLATLAEVALYAGQAALDAGNLALARSLHDAAQDLTVGTNDPVLGIHVLVAQSMLQARMARAGGRREPARQALHLARTAAEEARYEPVPQLHALIATCHARAAALLGDKHAFEAAITRAARELRRPRIDDAGALPAWLKHFGPTEVMAAEAAGAVDLGETARCFDLYHQALEAASCPRDRALLAACLAHAQSLQGEGGEAVTVALGIALPALESGVSSTRCLDQLRDVAAAAGAVRGVLELRERVDRARRGLPGAPGTGEGPPANLVRLPA
jgi:transcriptional regulator with XRE-family HTH domain